MKTHYLLFTTSTIDSIKQIFESTNVEGLLTIADHYWLITNESIDNCHLCTITDMITSDLRSLDDNEIYCNLIDKHGNDIVGKFIHHEFDDNIRDKLINIIKYYCKEVNPINPPEIILYIDDTNIHQYILSTIISHFSVSPENISVHDGELHIRIFG